MRNAFLFACIACVARATNRPSVVINNPSCAPIVNRYIDLNNSVTAIELFIVASTCEGIVHPMDSGLGGGFQMVFHRNGVARNAVYVNAREMSYADARFLPQQTGRTARHIGVPGMLRGYRHIYNSVHRYYGKGEPSFSWARLFHENSILAHNGFNISRTLSNVIMGLDLNDSPWILSKTHRYIRSPILGDYLDRVAKNRGDIYNASDPDHGAMINELRAVGSPIRSRDLTAYRVVESAASRMRCLDWIVFTSRLPGSGSLQLFGCRMLHHAIRKLGYINWSEEKKFIFMIWSMHYMYSLQPHLPFLYSRRGAVKQLLLRDSRLCARYVNRHWKGTLPMYATLRVGQTRLTNRQIRLSQRTANRGTSNICAYDIRGGSLCATSTVNWGFGSGYASRRMGFFYNNQLADFTYGNVHSYNRPRPWKRPTSSISPTLFVNATTKRLDFEYGAAGGRKIVSSNFVVMTKLIEQIYTHRNVSCEKAEAFPRCVYHLKAFRDRVYTFLECESSMSESLKAALDRRGVVVKYSVEAGYSSVTTLSHRRNGKCYDMRRGGIVV